MKYLLVLFPIFIHGAILQTEHIEDVLSYVDQSTVVFFDVDDTLFTSNVQLGRAHRFLEEWSVLKKQGFDEKQALEICREHWDAIQKKCLVRHLEPEIKSVLETVQARGLYTMALTARAPRTVAITTDQLRFLDLDFTICCPLKLQVELPLENHYQDGIWFVELNEKGKSVRKWLDTIPIHPGKIILIDDTYKHLKNMEEYLADLKIEFIGIHYTKAQKTPYRPEIAQKQWEYFPKIITDEEASLLLLEIASSDLASIN
jgi:hypothetical protein